MTEEKQVNHILIFGNFVDGFTFRGPFDSPEQATEYGDKTDEEWWLAELTPPFELLP